MLDIACILGSICGSHQLGTSENDVWFPGFLQHRMKKTEDFIYGKDNVVNDENVCLLMKIGEVA